MSEEYSVLSKQQRERVEALQVAAALLRSTTIGGSKPADWPDIVSVAEYILSGSIDGLDTLRDISGRTPIAELDVPDLWDRTSTPEQ